MPVFRLECESCHLPQRLLRSKAPVGVVCPECGGACRRAAAEPGVSAVEVLDNGAMSRPVERYAEIERLRPDAIRAVDADAVDQYKSQVVKK